SDQRLNVRRGFERREDEVGDRAPVAAAGASHPDPQAEEVPRSERLRDGAQPVVAGEASAPPRLQTPLVEVDVVVNDEKHAGGGLEEASSRGDRAARLVHVRLGLEQPHLPPRQPDLRQLPGELAPEGARVPSRELVDDQPSCVVTRTLVLSPRIAEPGDEEIERRGAVAPTREPHQPSTLLGPAEVELEAVRNAERQSLHRDLPDERRQDAPLPHSRCLADQLDGHLGRDHLVEANLVQVEVRDPAPDRIHLEVLEDRGVRRLLALEHDVEDGVTSVRPGEYASQRPLRHRDRVRLLAAPVQDAGNETRAAQPRARPRSGAFALLHLQPDPLSCHGGRLYPQARGGRPRAVSQKSCVSPPKIAETESSANTFMIVSASRPEIGSTVMLSGRRRGSIGTVSVTTMPARS